MNGITVCVDYSDLLAKTLPTTRHHFQKFMVVTHPDDVKTILLASSFGCEVHATTVFYTNGAHFAKWAALEEGFDRLGREGWICVIDADIALPETLPVLNLVCGNLYGPRRRMMRDVSGPVPPSSEWSKFPLYPSKEFAGWMQLFHAKDPKLPERGWYQTTWSHAGGADTFFQRRWYEHEHVRLPFEVLHLGQEGVNWCGRVSQRVDGSVPDLAEQRRANMESMIKNRRRTGTYNGEHIQGLYQ